LLQITEDTFKSSCLSEKFISKHRHMHKLKPDHGINCSSTACIVQLTLLLKVVLPDVSVSAVAAIAEVLSKLQYNNKPTIKQKTKTYDDDNDSDNI